MEPERELATRAAAGDVAAFTTLVRSHEGAVRRFLTRLTHGSDADDLAQDTFVKAWRTAGAYSGNGSYRSWLLRIAWTSFLDARRGAERRTVRDHAAAGEDTWWPDPASSIDLARALNQLGERERVAALLCFAEGCSHGEAAQVMGLALGTLKSILGRARTSLAAALETIDG